jgi:tape measure domain-containing protein
VALNAVEILIRVRDEASQALQGLQRQVSRTAAANRREWEAMSKVSAVALGAITAAGGAAIATGLKFVTLAGQLEQSKIAFETMLGSAEAADAFLRDLADFAAATPFDFPGLQSSSRLLLAFGFQAEAVIPIVETLGDATSALGGGTDTLEGVVRALGQMQTKGKVVTQELLQLAERGIPVFDILKEKLELTGEQVADIGTLGISSSTAITAILEGLGERFGGAMQKQSRTLLGLWSTVKDTGLLIATDLGTKISEALDLTGLLETLVGWLDTLRERVADIDLKQLWLDGREGIITFAGALVGMALPAIINLVRAVLPLVTRLAALALAGALVVDVAQQLGVDFGKLSDPGGALARVGSVLIGLADVFKGVTISIANLILASSKSFRDWADFFRLAAEAVGNVIRQLGRQATAVTDLLAALATFDGSKITAAWDSLRNIGGFSLGADLTTAWSTSFDGFSDAILDGFDRANAYVTGGWEKILAGFSGHVDDTTNQVVTRVAGSVSDGAKKIIDWSTLLTNDATPALLDVADASDQLAASITASADEAAKAAATWQDALETIGAAAAVTLRDALGVDQPDSPLVAAGKAIVASIAKGFNEAWPEFTSRLTTAWSTVQDMLAQAALQRHVASGVSLRLPETGPAKLGSGSPFIPAPIGIEGRRAPADPSAFMPAIVRMSDALFGPRSAPGRFLADLEGLFGRAEREANRSGRVDQYVIREAQAARFDAAGTLAYHDRVINDPRSAAFRREIPVPSPFAGVPRPVAIPEPGVFAVLPEARGLGITPGAEVRPDRSALPQEQLDAILRKELEARQAVVDGLTTMSTENGPLANFGTQLLAAASEAVPAFGAALDGFVQAGPIGAIIGFFSELLFSSEPMIEAFEMINEALAPLGDILASIIAPALKVFGMVLGWIVDGLIAVWNFLFGWLGVHIERKSDEEPPPAEAPVHSSVPPTQREPEFGRVGPGIQLAVATPLIEAAQLQLTAANTLQTAATGLAESAAHFGDYVGRLVEEGIRVRVEQLANPAPQSRTAYLR